VKSLLLQSHGQANVERGFSVNKQVEIDSLTEDTFVAKHLICDHVPSVGGLKNIDISNEALLLAASSARHKYMDYLEGERKKKESTGRGEKRKALGDEIKELKNKKRCMEKMWMLGLHQLMSLQTRQKKPSNLLGYRNPIAYVGQQNRKQRN